MECIDFDARFNDYIGAWIQKNQKRFKRPEEIEERVPGVYVQFLNEPADWLGGKTPSEYFDAYDAGALTDWLRRYAQDDVPVPDPLLNRLEALADEPSLLALALDTSAPCTARMHAVELLRQMDSRAPMTDYLRWQVERREDDELLENALESLRMMGEAARAPAKIAFLAADDAGKEALLDVLCDAPGDEDVFQFALKRFEQHPESRALYASYLAKLDDDRALEKLLDVAESSDVSYIDFIEIRSAIERLGGEAPVRDFRSDPTYKAVHRAR